MNANRSSAKQSDECYAVKYVYEGPERECFYQDPETFCNDLSEATVFQSSESARRTARAMDNIHPAGPKSHAVVRVKLGLGLREVGQRKA